MRVDPTQPYPEGVRFAIPRADQLGFYSQARAAAEAIPTKQFKLDLVNK
jgi:hypothetical protein